jgi:hypothetical protein
MGISPALIAEIFAPSFVNASDLMAEIGDARAGNEPHVSRADHCKRASLLLSRGLPRAR